jgi:hypothetical protein
MIEMTSDIAKTFKELIKQFEEVLQRFAASGAKIHIHKTFKWTLADTEAFETLRSAVTSDSCLTQFNSRLPTTLYVDASATGLGAILCQIYPVTGTRVVAFASRKLSDCESRYSNTERELLAITWAVTIRFRLQLTGVSFTVFTDHQALIHECRLRVPSARVANMLLHLDCFQITLKYYPGKLNVGADFLSRMPEADNASTAQSTISIFDAQTPDQEPQESQIRDSINAIDLPNTRKQVSSDRIQEIISRYHEDELRHFGFTKLLNALRQRYSWPDLRLSHFDFTMLKLYNCK